MDTSTSAYRLMELIAISGECSPRVLAHLHLSGSYGEKLITRLKKEGHIRTHYKDGLRGYRLTSRGEKAPSGRKPCPLLLLPLRQLRHQPSPQRLPKEAQTPAGIHCLCPAPGRRRRNIPGQEGTTVLSENREQPDGSLSYGTASLLPLPRGQGAWGGSRKDQQFQDHRHPACPGVHLCRILHRRRTDEMGIPDGTEGKGVALLPCQ